MGKRRRVNFSLPQRDQPLVIGADLQQGEILIRI